MVAALIAAFLATGCLASSPDGLPAFTTIIPQDLKASFPPSASLAAIPSVVGVPLESFLMTIRPAEPVKDPGPMRNTQAVRVELAPLFNRHVKNAESAGTGVERFFLSTQISLKGEVFMSVQGEGWAEPYFYPVKSDMSPRWQSTSGRTYSAGIDGSIFRRKFNNLLVIRDEGSDRPVYSRKLSDFFYSAYRTGDTAVIGGNTYKVFYSNLMDTSRSPVVFDKSAYGLCLLYDESEDPGYHDIQAYPIPFSAVAEGKTAAYRLHDGQVLYLRLDADQKTLVISD